MQCDGKRYIVHGSRSDRFKIWNVSDVHRLNRGCAVGEFKRDIETIKNDPYSFWIGGGDYADFIGYRDKRFDPDCVPEDVPVKQLGRLGKYGMELIRDDFAPIADKCLGLLLGNHELKYQLHTEQSDMHAWLCEELGVRNLGYSALFDLVFVRVSGVKRPRLELKAPRPSTSASFRVFCHHGAGASCTPGGKLNRLVQFMQSFDADLYFCGHVHDQVARQEPAIGADPTCKKLVQRRRLGLVSGSYLKTYQQGQMGYGEQKGYRPTNLGSAVALITPETGDVRAQV